MRMSRSFAALAIALLVSFSPGLLASGGESHLIVRRAASFGNDQWLRLWIDGKAVDPVAYGQFFESSVPSGHHIIAADQSVDRWHTRPREISVNFEPGRTYRFVAIRHNDSVYLKIAH